MLGLMLPSVTVTLLWGSVTEENYEPTDIMPSGSRMSSTAGASTSSSCPSKGNKDHFLVIPVVHLFSNWRLSNTSVRHMCITCLIRRVLLDRLSMVRMNRSQQKLLHWQSLNNHTSYTIYICQPHSSGSFLVCNRYFRDISILPGRTWKFYMSVAYFQVGPGTITIFMSNVPYQVRPGNIYQNFLYIPTGRTSVLDIYIHI